MNNTVSDPKNIVSEKAILDLYSGVRPIDRKSLTAEEGWEAKFQYFNPNNSNYANAPMFYIFVNNDYLLISIDDTYRYLITDRLTNFNYNLLTTQNEMTPFLDKVFSADPTKYDVNTDSFGPLVSKGTNIEYYPVRSMYNLLLASWFTTGTSGRYWGCWCDKESIRHMYKEGAFNKTRFNITSLLPGSEMVPADQSIDTAQKAFDFVYDSDYENLWLMWKLNGFKPTEKVVEAIGLKIVEAYAHSLNKNITCLANSTKSCAIKKQKDAEKENRLEKIRLQYNGYRRFIVTIDKIEDKPTKTGKTYHVIDATSADGYPVRWNEFFNHTLNVGDKLDINATLYMSASAAVPFNRFEKCWINGKADW